jgi:hypothetical protein
LWDQTCIAFAHIADSDLTALLLSYGIVRP